MNPLQAVNLNLYPTSVIKEMPSLENMISPVHNPNRQVSKVEKGVMGFLISPKKGGPVKAKHTVQTIEATQPSR